MQGNMHVDEPNKTTNVPKENDKKNWRLKIQVKVKKLWAYIKQKVNLVWTIKQNVNCIIVIVPLTKSKLPRNVWKTTMSDKVTCIPV
jgi:hypothetical protein